MSLIIILAIAAIMVILLFAIAQLRQTRNKSNRYKSRKKHRKTQEIKEPVFNENEIQSAEVKLRVPDQSTEKKALNLDSDAILGLKSYTEKPAQLEKKASSESGSTNDKVQSPQQSVIVLHVMADAGHAYSGYELLQTLLSSGLRYGKYHIFHRYAQNSAHSDILFSVASATSPGTFDLQQMGGFSCCGLSLFFIMEKVNEPMQVFELMLETAGQLVEGLGGQVFDSKHHLLTRDSVLAIRRQIRAFEESSRTADLFAEGYTEVEPT